MSDDPTQELPTGDQFKGADTTPTTVAVMERVNALGDRIDKRFDDMQQGIDKRFDGVDKRFDHMRQDVDIRLDRIESLSSATRSEMLTLRADFNEFRKEFRERFPQLEPKP